MSNLHVVAPRRGGPDILQLRNGPTPEPGPGAMCIAVEAAGVAFADVLVREGLYPGVSLPQTLGYDAVGRVTAVGAGVDGWAPGQRVAALTVTGGYAQRVCVPAPHAVPVADTLDAAEAVALVLNYLTAWQLLHRCVRLSPGAAILVHGGAGGVGSALLQIARLADLRVYATVSRGKRALVEALGAVAIDYQDAGFVATLRRLQPGGVAVVFDAIGGVHARRSYRCLHPTGTLVVYGASSVTRGGRCHLVSALRNLLLQPRFSPLGLLNDGRTVSGYNVVRWRDQHPELYRADLAHLFDLLEQKRIAPVIAGRLPLAEAARAHRLLGETAPAGKLVLMP